MEEIFGLYKKNKGIKPLFSIYYIIDWYDGVLSGIGNLSETNDFYLINIVAWDIVFGMKIFSIVKLTSLWMDKFKDAINQTDSNLVITLIEDYIRQCSSDIFLLKAKYIDALEYDLVRLDANSLHLYNGIEEIVNQSDEEKLKWFNLFK